MRKCFWVIIVLLLSFNTMLAQKPGVKSADIVLVDGQDYYIHIVVKGETLYSLSKLYDTPIATIEEENPPLVDGLKVGQAIKIPCKQIPEPKKLSPRKKARTFLEHTVAKGETAYSIARKYAISIKVLVEDNPGLDPAKIAVDQVLNVRKSEMGETSPVDLQSELETYAVNLTNVSDDYVYHVVDVGETIYSLSKRYEVTQAQITANNNVEAGLKAGAIIKVPVTREARKASAEEVYEQGKDIVVRDFLYAGNINIAMLLPLSMQSGRKNIFMEFYQGALLALEEFKYEGYSIDVNVFDTKRSADETMGIVATDDFRKADMIIGPVYEESLPVVMEYSRDRGIPVISPFAHVDGGYGKQLYQMSPAQEYKYDKLKETFTEDKNIIFITTDNTDAEFEREMTEIAAELPFKKVMYGKDSLPETIEVLLEPRKPNMFVVLSDDEVGVEMALAAISSIQNNRQARSVKTGAIQVVGNSRWLRYLNLERNLLFKLNVTFVTSYHADRSNEIVSKFDRRYIEAFKDTPTSYSYRGYEAIKIFVESIATRPNMEFFDRVNLIKRPLQTPYEFKKGWSGNNVNSSWVLVTYRSNYSINVK